MTILFGRSVSIITITNDFIIYDLLVIILKYYYSKAYVIKFKKKLRL